MIFFVERKRSETTLMNMNSGMINGFGYQKNQFLNFLFFSVSSRDEKVFNHSKYFDES